MPMRKLQALGPNHKDTLASVYNLAQIFSGLLWGRASDLIGRRPVISFGIVAAAASTLGLGVATSLPAALATR